MITFESHGDFKSTEKLLAKIKAGKLYQGIDGVASSGISALSAATPVDTGLAARSWSYEVKVNRNGCIVNWNNSDLENGFPVALMRQTGYATGTGGYVSGIDYINPVMKPVFDQIVNKIWKGVTSG